MSCEEAYGEVLGTTVLFSNTLAAKQCLPYQRQRLSAVTPTATDLDAAELPVPEIQASANRRGRRLACWRGDFSRKVTFVPGSPRIHADPFGGWRGIVESGVDVFEIKEEHMSIFDEPPVIDLAEKLQQCPRQARFELQIPSVCVGKRAFEVCPSHCPWCNAVLRQWYR